MNDKIRADFEAWVLDGKYHPKIFPRIFNLERYEDTYSSWNTHTAWNAYKDCAESMQADKDKLEARVKELEAVLRINPAKLEIRMSIGEYHYKKTLTLASINQCKSKIAFVSDVCGHAFAILSREVKQNE